MNSMTSFYATRVLVVQIALFSILSLFAFPAFGQTSSACTNLLVNPSFENGLNGWSTTGDLTISTDAFTGTKAAEICGGPGSVSQIVPAIPGEEYTGSVWGKLNGIPSFETSTLRFLDASYMPLPGAPTGFGFPSENEYTLRTYTATAPPDAAYVHLLVYKENNGCVLVDEAEICQQTNGTNCALAFSFQNKTCHDNGTPNDPTDDTFSIDLTVNSANAGVSTWDANVGGINLSGQYGETKTFGPIPIVGNVVSYNIIDVNIAGCLEGGTITVPPPCSDGTTCSVFAQVEDIECNDNDTPSDPSDDLFTYLITVLANGPCGSGWNAVGIGNGLYGGAYNLVRPIADGPITYVIFDNDLPGISTSVTVNPPLPCSSNSGDLIDLELSLAQPNANPAQWSSYPVIATLENNGDTPATDVQVSFAKPVGVVYTGGNEFDASQGTFNPNGDQVWSVGTLAPGESAILEVNYFLLASESPVAWAEVSAANETDADSTPGNGNSPAVNEDDEASTDDGPAPIFDLSVSNVLPITGTVTPGDNLTGEFSVSYAGTFGTVNFKYATYLSDDPVLSADDYLINNQLYQVTSFPSGVATPFQVNFTMPSGLPDGQIYFLAVVDPTDEIAETDEGNNVGFNSFLLDNGSNLPDLVLNSATLPASIPQGGSAEIDFTYSNIGTVDLPNIPGYGFEFYLSTDSQLSSDDSVIGNISTNGLDAGETRTVNGYNIFVPLNTVVGQYHIIGKIDISDQIEESNEANNVVDLGTLEIIDQNAVTIDLTVSNLVATTPTVRGTIYEYSFDINNIGTATADIQSGYYMGQVYLSEDDEFDPSVDQIIDIYYSGPNMVIPPGGSYAATGHGTIDVDTPIGEHFIFINIYSSSLVNELNYDNNTSSAAPFEVINSTVQGVDLEALSLNAEIGGFSGQLIFNYTFYGINNGTTIPNSQSHVDVAFYLSTDQNLDADDHLITVIELIKISDDDYFNSGDLVTVPIFPNGNYYFISKIDYSEIYDETDEVNNFLVTPTTIGNPSPNIDLSLAMTTANPSPPVYSNNELTLTLTNSGPQTATDVVVEFKRPTGTVYTGGNEWDASQGIFNPFGPETWEVGTLAAGETATLTVSYFLLTGNALTPFAEVLSANETDADSTPGNGTCCTPNEDDEATLTLNAFAGGGGISLNRPDMVGRDVQLRSINPNPVYFGETKVTLDSRVDGWFELETYDVFGRLAASQKVELREGRNEIILEVADFRSGTYYLNIPGENWRHMPIRFVVARW